MAGFTTPSGEQFPIFGAGGGQALADELGVPLLGQVPLTMSLREQADSGLPVVFANPRDAASEAITQIARRVIAMTPIELPVLAPIEPPAPVKAVGMSLPMA
jgi:ATP-binding protein involved in chromosome partitioning